MTRIPGMLAQLVIVAFAILFPWRSVNADDLKVTVKSAGNEPLNTLRIHPTKGAQTNASMTMTLSIEQSVAGSKLPANVMPPVKFGIQISVSNVATNGDISYDFKYTTVTVQDTPGLSAQVLASIKKAMKSMEGTKGHAVVTNRGITKSANVDLPPNADAVVVQQLESIKSSMKQIAFPLPEEPIGVGAIWEVETPIAQNGLTITQKSIFTLEDKHDDILELRIELAQSAEPQEIRSDRLPTGSSMHLDSLKSTGKGRSKLSLSEIFPTRAKVEIDSDSDMTINMNNTKQSMQQHMEMTMEVSGELAASKTAAAP